MTAGARRAESTDATGSALAAARAIRGTFVATDASSSAGATRALDTRHSGRARPRCADGTRGPAGARLATSPAPATGAASATRSSRGTHATRTARSTGATRPTGAAAATVALGTHNRGPGPVAGLSSTASGAAIAGLAAGTACRAAAAGCSRSARIGTVVAGRSRAAGATGTANTAGAARAANAGGAHAGTAVAANTTRAAGTPSTSRGCRETRSAPALTAGATRAGVTACPVDAVGPHGGPVAPGSTTEAGRAAVPTVAAVSTEQAGRAVALGIDAADRTGGAIAALATSATVAARTTISRLADHPGSTATTHGRTCGTGRTRAAPGATHTTIAALETTGARRSRHATGHSAGADCAVTTPATNRTIATVTTGTVHARVARHGAHPTGRATEAGVTAPATRTTGTASLAHDPVAIRIGPRRRTGGAVPAVPTTTTIATRTTISRLADHPGSTATTHGRTCGTGRTRAAPGATHTTIAALETTGARRSRHHTGHSAGADCAVTTPATNGPIATVTTRAVHARVARHGAHPTGRATEAGVTAPATRTTGTASLAHDPVAIRIGPRPRARGAVPAVPTTTTIATRTTISRLADHPGSTATTHGRTCGTGRTRAAPGATHTTIAALETTGARRSRHHTGHSAGADCAVTTPATNGPIATVTTRAVHARVARHGAHPTGRATEAGVTAPATRTTGTASLAHDPVAIRIGPRPRARGAVPAVPTTTTIATRTTIGRLADHPGSTATTHGRTCGAGRTRSTPRATLTAGTTGEPRCARRPRHATGHPGATDRAITTPATNGPIATVTTGTVHARVARHGAHPTGRATEAGVTAPATRTTGTASLAHDPVAIRIGPRRRTGGAVPAVPTTTTIAARTTISRLADHPGSTATTHGRTCGTGRTRAAPGATHTTIAALETTGARRSRHHTGHSAGADCAVTTPATNGPIATVTTRAVHACVARHGAHPTGRATEAGVTAPATRTTGTASLAHDPVAIRIGPRPRARGAVPAVPTTTTIATRTTIGRLADHPGSTATTHGRTCGTGRTRSTPRATLTAGTTGEPRCARRPRHATGHPGATDRAITTPATNGPIATIATGTIHTRRPGPDACSANSGVATLAAGTAGTARLAGHAVSVGTGPRRRPGHAVAAPTALAAVATLTSGAEQSRRATGSAVATSATGMAGFARQRTRRSGGAVAAAAA
ncbi:hypothetical protein [Mycolicibacterium sediminis]|uniref:Uncharacterized protein n=2 Tax=Mycolicibacterium sediminis TaxID=1286180 RepID=A0A7I7QZ86_9MYCO|nr:hypothetical protein [Mycolicibacterium sediminis]BBY31297.1 hypothetical protein MSEDJ_53930 [Mycolicibacterium sediminis]